MQFEAKELKKLVAWYEQSKRAFPWREDSQPYKVWIAEIMSQQTQMSALMPYYERFMKRFSAVEALASASLEDVLKAWTGLGYYSRAKNLHKAAQKIADAGAFPESYEEWLELPGVGPYTAAAVVSQSFNKAHAVWDGNVLRVSSRFFGESQPYTASFKARVLVKIEKAMQDFPPSALNQALMELGALVCTPQNPRCDRCPLENFCEARAKSLQSALPPPKPRKASIEVNAKVFVFLKKKKNGLHVLLQERQSGSWYSGLWDFPSELGSVKKPLVDGVGPESKIVLRKVTHTITHHKIALIPHVFLESSCDETKLGGKWVLVGDAFGDEPRDPVATTARKVMRVVGKYLAEDS